MKLIEEENDKNKEDKENRINENEPNKNTHKNKQPKLLKAPTIDIDKDGNVNVEDENSASRVDNNMYNWTEVKLQRRRWETRPSLSQTMETKVNEDLEKHFETKYRNENCPKTKNQKQMTPGERKDLIQKMLDKSGFKIGIAPLTNEHRDKVEKLLDGKGLFKRNDTPQMRKIKTIKSIIKSWTMRNLQMTEQEWNTIKISDITINENSYIAFITVKTKDDISKFTIKAKNLPKEQNNDTPKLIMYVDKRAAKRHKAFLNIAKSIRDHSQNTTQTNVRTGKSDFLLRTRTKGSNVPWNELPPVKITQVIPEFEIGIYKDIVNPQNNVQNEHDIREEDQEENIEDLEQIISDITRQNSE